MAMLQHRAHPSRSSIGQHLNPANGFRGEQERRGIIPTNHALDNRRALRDLQARNRQRKLEEESAKDEAKQFKMAQFKNVASRLHEQPSHRQPPADRNFSKVPEPFLKRGSLNKRQQARAAAAAANPERPRTPRTSAKPSVPNRRDVGVLKPRESKNFVGENRDRATQLQARSAAVEESPRRHADFGRTPEYLQERKAEMSRIEAERRARAEVEEDCPPGMTLMPERERLETLAVLKQSEQDTHQALCRLPLRVTTHSMTKRKNELEAKLQEIEAAKKIFSRPKVYVTAN